MSRKGNRDWAQRNTGEVFLFFFVGQTGGNYAALRRGDGNGSTNFQGTLGILKKKACERSVRGLQTVTEGRGLRKKPIRGRGAGGTRSTQSQRGTSWSSRSRY